MPLVALALVAFVAGLVLGGGHRSGEEDVAERYARAWERGDHDAMYRLLTSSARERTTRAAFRRAHERDADTATTSELRLGEASEPDDGVVTLPARARTRIFGTIRTRLALPVVDDGDAKRVDWRRHLAFPGVRRDERLGRTTRLPSRATLLAADGTVLARGEDRVPEDAELAASIAGAIGPIPPERAAELRAEGVPDGASVGLTGLERALDDELRGQPGGELRAGERTLAVVAPRPADPVRSSIVPSVQRAAVAALAGRLGGVVAIEPSTGEVQAAAGIGFSGLQPPGSVFKIVTLAGALQAGITSPSRRYPVETATTIEGVRLENANAESCGGTLRNSFAHSCNTVFAPLGAQLGARRLVGAAEAFGFNAPPGIDGAAESTIPPAQEIGDDLAVGSSAIGQGRVQATALQMAVVGATIAERGRRPRPTLLADARPRFERAIPPRTARTVARAMRAVVQDGTGTGAALDGVGVAGKTGTAELRSTVAPQLQPGQTALAPPAPEDTTDTTAWFTAYAPTRRPRIVVALMLVEGGTGGATAAPATKGVLQAALRRRP